SLFRLQGFSTCLSLFVRGQMWRTTRAKGGERLSQVGVVEERQVASYDCTRWPAAQDLASHDPSREVGSRAEGRPLKPSGLPHLFSLMCGPDNTNAPKRSDHWPPSGRRRDLLCS